MEKESLLLTDVKAEEEADDLMASLTNIAYATPKEFQPEVQQQPSTGKHRSRFFFRPTRSFTASMEQSKKSQERDDSAVTVLDKEVEARRKTYSKELPKALNSNIAQVREFFLKEIAPLTLAAQAGTAQAREVAQRVLSTEIDNTGFLQFERMVSRASTIKMARFIAAYLKLPLRTVEELLEIVKPQAPKEIMLVNNDPLGDRRIPKAKEKPETPLGD